MKNKNRSFLSYEIVKIITIELSIGLAIFIMIITNTEHPPASVTALAITIQGWTFSTILVTLITVIILLITKYIANPWLKDLV